MFMYHNVGIKIIFSNNNYSSFSSLSFYFKKKKVIDDFLLLFFIFITVIHFEIIKVWLISCSTTLSIICI